MSTPTDPSTQLAHDEIWNPHTAEAARIAAGRGRSIAVGYRTTARRIADEVRAAEHDAHHPRSTLEAPDTASAAAVASTGCAWPACPAQAPIGEGLCLTHAAIAAAATGAGADDPATEDTTVTAAALRSAANTIRTHQAQPRWRRRGTDPLVAAATETIEARWKQARTRHLGVKDAYAALLADPLTALTHSALWDTLNPRTSRFITLWAQISDLEALHPRLPEAPAEIETVVEYTTLARDVTLAWEDSLAHAEQLGYTWLEAAEAAKARKVAGLLRRAADTGATTAERQVAAEKATTMLRTIRGLRIPAQTTAEIAATARLALPAPR